MTRQFFLMIGSLEVTHELIGSLEVTHELIFIIPSVIQISSINSIRLRLILGKHQLTCTPLDVNLHPVFKKIKTYCILPYRHYVFLARSFRKIYFYQNQIQSKRMQMEYCGKCISHRNNKKFLISTDNELLKYLYFNKITNRQKRVLDLSSFVF